MADITAVELHERIEQGEILYLLDVREELEYHTYNVGGTNIPLGKLAQEANDLEWNKDDEIIVICKIGLRSKTGKLILMQNGYNNVKNLEGGLISLQKLNKNY